MASIMAGYHAVMAQLYERTRKEMHAGKPERLRRSIYKIDSVAPGEMKTFDYYTEDWRNVNVPEREKAKDQERASARLM